jgi:5-methylcytosine-specific restriction endonuclease McrA
VRAPRLCSKGPCNNVQPCPIHPKPRWAQTRTATERGYGAEHARLRKIVLREEPICYICRVLPSVTADHVIPLSQGGQTVRANMRGACDPCQRRKAAHEGVAARQAMR